jgi:hypothetical protein
MSCVMSATAGYSGTPLWKKLGYRDGLSAYAQGAPAGYRGLLALPSEVGVTWDESLRAGAPFVHLFTASRSELKSALVSYRNKITPDGTVWVSWPKKSSGVTTDITEDTIREIALPLGFVDTKVCAIDGVWSGLKLVIRKVYR